MKNLYIALLFFILAGCSDENESSINNTIIKNQAPVIFTLSNSKDNKLKDQSHIEQMELADDNKAITISMEQEEWCNKHFSPSQTKTSWTDTDNKVTWTPGDQIGIFMRDASGSNSYLKNNVPYSVSSKTGTSSLIASSSPLYFPNRSSNIRFYAYYPYTETSNSLLINYTIPADQSTDQALGKADIMYAPTLSYTGASPNVSLNFSHQMSLLSFRIKGGLLSGLFTLTQVSISGSAITNTGTLDLVTGTLTPSTTSTFTIIVNTSKSVSSSEIANVDVIINPCTITSNSALLPTKLKVTLTFSGLGLIHSTNLVSNGTFAKGTRYIYNLTVAL